MSRYRTHTAKPMNYIRKAGAAAGDLSLPCGRAYTRRRHLSLQAAQTMRYDGYEKESRDKQAALGQLVTPTFFGP